MAILGHPRALRMVWQRHQVDSDAPPPNYSVLYLRFPRSYGVDFAE